LSGLRLEFREPYPVYRGLRVPVWEGGRPVKVRRVTDEDRRAFAEAMGKLRSLLQSVSKAASALNLSQPDKLSLLVDAIVVFLKAPLIQEAVPAAPTPLKAQALSLLAPKLRRMLWSQDLYDYARRLAGLTGEELGFAEELFQAETMDLVYRLWIAFPADTRPGYNTSSLIAHSLMTSAIAWRVGRARDRVEEAVIRLSALLHDLGKAVDPEMHYKASEELAKALLGGLVEDEVLERVAAAVRDHHLIAELSWADRLAAAADRLDKLVEKTIGNKLAKIEGLLGGSRGEWAFWRAVYERRGELVKSGLAVEDPLKELTEEFLEGVSAAARDPELAKEVREAPELQLILIDVTSIQDFVLRSQEVRVVAAASHLIELAVQTHFLEYLRNNGLGVPPEVVLYAGGGNILLLLPSDMVARVEMLAKEYSEKSELKLAVASVPFSDSYVDASKHLAVRMFVKKHTVEPSQALNYSQASGRTLCTMCHSDWAETTVRVPEGPRNVCKICGRLYEVGSELHFGPKWRAVVKVCEDSFTAEDAFGFKWKDVSRWVIEIIAGHQEDLREGVERARDYAAIKLDGNAMGSFMLEAVSFTDAIERSFRIDVALKKAYFKALEALYRGVKKVADLSSARREAARVVLGMIYIGGDDGFMLAPSWAAVFLAHFIAEEFSKHLGLERGLRVAVAAGPAKMSVWALLDCASMMMKKAGEAIRREDPTARERILSAVAFDVFEAGSPSEASVAERMEQLSRRVQGASKPRDEGIDGLQPYFIKRQDLQGSSAPELWSTLIPLVLDLAPRSGWSDREAFDAYVEALGIAYLSSRSEKIKEGEVLSSIRNAILRSWGAVSPSKYWREKLLVYLYRQLARREGEEGALEETRDRGEGMKEAYTRLARFTAAFLSSNGMKAVPLADALTLIKLVKGGVW
jgi:HD superfamily phosphodiesterase